MVHPSFSVRQGAGPVESLLRSAARLNIVHRCLGWYARDRDGYACEPETIEACSWCMTGALINLSVGASRTRELAARRLFEARLSHWRMRGSIGTSCSVWHDSMSKRALKQWWARAIAIAEREGL